MYRVMLRFAIGLIMATACGLSGFAHAQQQEKKQGIQFSCMLWNGPLPEKIYYQDGQEYHEVIPFTGSRSLPHWLEKSEEFRLFTRKEAEQGDGRDAKPVYTLVGESKLLGDVSPVLFILSSGMTETGLQIRILALDDSVEGFPPGSFRFANFSTSNLLVKFAGVVKKVPSKEITLMKSGIGKEGGLVPFLIGSEDGRKVFETRLFAQAHGREIVFIGPPKPGGRLPSVRFLSQLLPAAR